VAYYVHKILKGARPRDLPVEIPDKAGVGYQPQDCKALGLEVPPTLLARATR